MIDGPPKGAALTVDLDEHFVQMPSRLRPGAQPPCALLAGLVRKHRAKPMPPEPHRLMADVDAAFGHLRSLATSLPRSQPSSPDKAQPKPDRAFNSSFSAISLNLEMGKAGPPVDASAQILVAKRQTTTEYVVLT